MLASAGFVEVSDDELAKAAAEAAERRKELEEAEMKKKAAAEEEEASVADGRLNSPRQRENLGRCVYYSLTAHFDV